MANLNRRQKRELERQNKKEKPGKTKPAPRAPPVQSSTTERRRVTAENGKVLIVDSMGDVFLEEEDEDGNVQEFLLDLDEIHKPTIWDTGVVRLPVWLYRKAFDPFLKNTDPILSDDAAPSVKETVSETIENILPDKGTSSDLSSSQDSGFEIVDSTGLETKPERGAGVKQRGKKGKK